MFENENPFI
jgi:14-3-3 protein epsilon